MTNEKSEIFRSRIQNLPRLIVLPLRRVDSAVRGCFRPATDSMVASLSVAGRVHPSPIELNGEREISGIHAHTVHRNVGRDCRVFVALKLFRIIIIFFRRQNIRFAVIVSIYVFFSFGPPTNLYDNYCY